MVWLDAHGDRRRAWWSHHSSDLTIAGAWFAVGDTRAGEDGTPCVRVREGGEEGLIAVFDGLGGAGTRPAWQMAEHEKPLSSACVASNVASLATLRWHQRGDLSADRLKDDLLEALREADDASNVPKPRFSGSALRQLPTTLAAMTYCVMDSGRTMIARSLSVGDSRCYVLDAEGLRQLSADDTRGEPDALEALRSAPPMTATVGLDRPFDLGEQAHAVATPVVLLVATDGCTDYVVAPHHLELRLLRALADAPDATVWARLIIERIAGVAGDDATLLALAYGYGSFAALQDAFAERLRTLEELEAATVGRSDPADAAAKDRAADEAWASYRTTYESLQRKAPSA